jgi:hypothetical protein
MRVSDRRRYRLTLARRKATLARLRRRAHKGTLTLVSLARGVDEHNDVPAMTAMTRAPRRDNWARRRWTCS